VAAIEGDAKGRAPDPTVRSRTGAAEPASGVPEEVVPQRTPPRVAPVTKTKPSRRLRPGDLICGQCGEGNEPTRKFCSRCGEELTTATVVKTRWYRKLLRRKTKVMEAGARPGQPGAKAPMSAKARSGWRTVIRVVGLFTMGLTMLAVFLPGVRVQVDAALGHPIQKVQDWWAHQRDPYERVFPVDWSANRLPRPGHNARATFDDNTLTYWATPWRPNRRRLDTFLTVTFSEPVKDLVVFVYAGAPGDEFTRFHSPSELRFDYGDGRPNDTADLARDQKVQGPFTLEHADGVEQITIWIDEVAHQRGATDVAIAELEFREQN